MRIYSSFLIRCWLTYEGTSEERPVIDVEHIQSGGHTRVADLTDAQAWMFEACRTLRPPTSAPAASEQKAAGGEKPV